MKYTKKQNKLIIKISLRSSDDGEKTTWLPSGTTNFTRNNGHVVLAVSVGERTYMRTRSSTRSNT